METFELDSSVRGYHVYREVWNAVYGEELQCVREPTNAADRYAIAVTREGTVVGHLPHKISRLCVLFMKRRGTITCRVIGRRKYSDDLPKGGLEVPGRLFFFGKPVEVKKLVKLFQM